MPTEIAPSVYDITCRTKADGARYRVFFFTEETPTLFDTGFTDTAETVIEAIDKIGIDPERLIITHGDGDHIGGYDILTSEYNLESWVPEQTTVELENKPTQRYSDGTSIGRFHAIHVPGHEPDNHVLVNENAKIAVMGDAVSGADQRGLPAGHFHLPPATYSQNLNQAEGNLDKLLDYEFEIGLVYHGSSVMEDAQEKLKRYVNFTGR